MQSLKLNIDPSIKQTITPLQAWNLGIVPHEIQEGTLRLFIDKSKNLNGVKQEIEVITGKQVELISVDKDLLIEALKKYYPRNNQFGTQVNLKTLFKNKEELVEEVIFEAAQISSSDIHFEAREKDCRIRYRIDGQLLDKYIFSVSEYPSIVNAIKIKSNLDIAEKRLPQDGRMVFKKDLLKIDLRVSIVPTINGEKIVLRILNKDTSNLNLEEIGFSKDQLNDYLKGIYSSHGIVLISGPTGSGKTTTLYATLKKLNTKEKNILTIEDPIEYTLEGINQVQLKEDIGLTFPAALRTFLRQDPDIIMIGEIRDSETAQIAIRSALTGHLVLSTIHTNSAIGIISRLMDMGIPDYLISATLNVAIAQRLIRLLCPLCKTKSKELNPLQSSFFQIEEKNSCQAVGCEQCNYTGFKGRRAIFEVVPIDKDLKEQIKSNQVESHTSKTKYYSLKAQAKEAFTKGETSFEEILPILLNA